MSHIKLFVDGYTDNMTMYDIMNKLSVDSDGLPLFYKIIFCWIVVDMFLCYITAQGVEKMKRNCQYQLLYLKKTGIFC